MPIDYRKYHPDWKQIRASILDREQHRCKFCQVPNYAYIFRGTIKEGPIEPLTEIYQMADGVLFMAEDGYPLFDGIAVAIDVQPLSGDPNQKAIKVVLTVAHLDHDITNNEPDNLAALCQKCHLRYDAKHHAKSSKATREAKMKAKTGQIDLFETK
jgi:hypothetical protein